jgi:hypothetical protein
MNRIRFSLLSDMAVSDFLLGDQPDADASASNLSFRLPHFLVFGRKFTGILWESWPDTAKIRPDRAKTRLFSLTKPAL